MSGLDQLNKLRAAGFSDDEVQSWQTRQMQQQMAAGFSADEVNRYWGVQEPNAAGLDTYMKQNLTAHAQANPGKPMSLEQAIDAGWQGSVSGLITRNKMPDVLPQADQPWYNRAATNLAQMIGDAPAALAGAIAGGTGGLESGPGAIATAAGGAFAVPTALRLTLMDAYQHGGFKSFSDFWDRFAPIAIDTAKSYVTGATAGAAGAVAGAAAATAAPVIKTVAQAAASLTTLTTVGKALDGKLPEPQDFLDGAVALLGAHAAMGGGAKLMDVYRATGISPAEVFTRASADPTIAQDLADATKPGIPAALHDEIDPNLPPAVQAAARGEPTPRATLTEPPVRPEPAAAPVEPTREPGTFEAAQQAILNKISTEPAQQTGGLSWQKFTTAFIDKLEPLRQASNAINDNATAASNPYKLMRLVSGVYGKANQFIENAPFDFNTYENTGPSLKSILAPFSDDLDGFRAYMASRRAVELESRGIQSGMPLEDAQRVATEGAGKYEAAFQQLQGYQDSLTRYLRDSGVLSDEAYQSMRDANKAYVPFNRVMDDTQGFGVGTRVRNPIKAIQGSERTVIDPLETIVRNTYAYMNIAERNTAARTFYQEALKTEDPSQFFEEVPNAMKAVTVTDPEMSRFLKENGVDDLPESALTVFRAMRKPLANDEIGFFDNGQYKVLKVDPDVADAFGATPPAQHGLLFKMLAFPAKMFRAGLTTPEFILRHLLRNQMAASTLAEDGNIPFWDTFKGVVSVLNKDDAYQNWLKSGGAMQAAFRMDRDNVQAAVREIAGQDPAANFLGRTWNVVKTPLEVMHAIQATLESGTRVGAFSRSIGDASDKASILESGFKSRNIAPDPARIGNITGNWNAITALFNIEIQHTDQLRTALMERPVPTLAKIFAGITLPSALLWMNNHDNPDYREVPAWERDAFWIVPMGDTMLRIPKPFLLGQVFGSGVERMLDGIFGDGDARSATEYANDLLEQSIPHLLPNAIRPILEQVTNFSFFRGGPLVPDRLQKLLPEYRYTEYTSELTKALGHIMGSVPYAGETSFASPLVVENYIRQWTGGAGVYALQLADAGLRKAGVLPDPPKPADTLADIPLIKAFVVRYPSATADSIQHFHEQYGQRKMVYDTFQELAKRGDTNAAMEVMKANPTAMMKLDGIETTLSQQTNLIRMIYRNPDIPGDQKRQLIDATYFQMIQISRVGDELIKQIDATAPMLGKDIQASQFQ